MSPDDPRNLIFSFLAELPQTIRAEAMLFVIWYASGNPTSDSQEFEDILRKFLLERTGIPAIRSVVCAAAAIDFSFVGFLSKLDSADNSLRILSERYPDNLAFQQSRLSLPLRKRHWEQAYADWRNLRNSKLSPQKLQDFADSQLIQQSGL
jgi:hypothetical protein